VKEGRPRRKSKKIELKEKKRRKKRERKGKKRESLKESSFRTLWEKKEGPAQTASERTEISALPSLAPMWSWASLFVLGVVLISLWRRRTSRENAEEGNPDQFHGTRSSGSSPARRCGAVGIFVVLAFCSPWLLGHLLWELEPVTGAETLSDSWQGALKRFHFPLCLWVRVFGCNYHTPRDMNCFDWHKTGNDTPSCCASKIHELLFDSADLMKAANITWWLTAGAFLGGIRHGGPIPWDTDTDICVLLPDDETLQRLKSQVFDIAKARWQRRTWTVSSRFYFHAFSNSNRNHLDFFVVNISRDNPSMLTNEDVIFPRDLVFPLRQCMYEGRFMPCPATTYEYLSLPKPLGILNTPHGVLNASQTGNALTPSYKHCTTDCSFRKERDMEIIRERIEELRRRNFVALPDSPPLSVTKGRRRWYSPKEDRAP
jgi:LicD family